MPAAPSGTDGKLPPGTVASDPPACRLKHTKRTETMTRYNPNVYEQQILAKGRDLPKAQPATGKVPAMFADRFATYAEYQEAMADFLNGN